MRKFLSYFLVVILFSVWGVIILDKGQIRETIRQTVKSFEKPCVKPVRYSIGQVDPQFGISEDGFRLVVSRSEDIWEKEIGKNLFEYDPEADFRINLVFDSRQSWTIELGNMEGKLGELGTSYKSAEKQFDSLSSQYKKKVNDYENRVADYQKKLERYNDKVEYWNSRGGAPEDEYEDLKDDKKDLERIFSALEKERKELNALVGKTNTAAEKTNDLAENYNQNLNTYQSKFGGSVQFDKGLYDGSSISIYQFYEETDLRLTLAHELGHALGIDHLENPKSLMYYLMGEQDMENPTLSEEDLSALKQVCAIN